MTNAASKRAWIIAAGISAAVIGWWIWPGRSRIVSGVAVDAADIERRAREHPDSVDAQVAFGSWLVQANRTEEAAPVLEQASRLAPGDARPYAWQGVAAIAQHRYGDGRQLLGEALRRDNTNTTALRALANLDAQQRRLRPAIRGFERFVKIQPNDADAWQRLGLLLIGVRENYRSFDALSHAAALDPRDVMTQRSLGNMALYANRLETARAAFTAALAIEPRDPQSLAGLAAVMMRLDSSPAGLAVAEREADAAVSAARSAMALRTRGEIYVMQRRLPEAIQDFNESIALEPNHRNTYVMLSQSYASAGKPDLARMASARFEQLTDRQLERDRKLGPRTASKKGHKELVSPSEQSGAQRNELRQSKVTTERLRP